MKNLGVITNINNAQGQGNSNGSLTYYGNLPTNYNVVINSPTSFGKLAATNVGLSTMSFGIYGSSILSPGRYLSVLTGVSASNLIGSYTNQTMGSYRWSLVDTIGTTWELDVVAIAPLMTQSSGPLLSDTQASVKYSSQQLQSVLALQNSVLVNSLSYDCNVFGANAVCVSAGGRNTVVSPANDLNNTSAILIAGYRINPKYRVGAFVDENLSVNNPGSTVSLGNNTPLIGVFGVWDEHLYGADAEVKISAAYGQKNVAVTRTVVGTSESGSGGSNLNSQGAQAEIKFGFEVAQSVLVSPYIGIRYTQNNIGGYREIGSASVTAPLTYGAINTNAVTALAGVGGSYRFTPQATVFVSAGVDGDINNGNGAYSATGVSGLNPIYFNTSPVKTRPTAMLGAYYDVEKNQRLGIAGIYRQEPYQGVQTTTVMVTYTIGM